MPFPLRPVVRVGVPPGVLMPGTTISQRRWHSFENQYYLYCSFLGCQKYKYYTGTMEQLPTILVTWLLGYLRKLSYDMPQNSIRCA